MTPSESKLIRCVLAFMPETTVLTEWVLQVGASVQFCETITEILPLAGSCDLLFVQLSQIQGRIEPVLKSLRQVSAGRIILLSSMVEEPMAIRMLDEKIADDYLVYPAGLADWLGEQLARQRKTAFPLLAEPTKAMQQLERLATEDDLTGLKNRRYVHQFLHQILAYADKEQFRVTILLFDIDNFKQYNDLYSHSVGDEVLRQVGGVIKHCCRAHDVVARIGGDEFAVVFWDMPTAEAAVAERRRAAGGHPREPLFMAQRFRRQLRETKPPLLGEAGKGCLTISGGLASFPDDSRDEAQLWDLADQAMLQAKRSGKNKILIVGKSADTSNTPASL